MASKDAFGPTKLVENGSITNETLKLDHASFYTCSGQVERQITVE
jgi:hypothetical protein